MKKYARNVKLQDANPLFATGLSLFVYTFFIYVHFFFQEGNYDVKQGLFRTENGVCVKYDCVRTKSLSKVFLQIQLTH